MSERIVSVAFSRLLFLPLLLASLLAAPLTAQDEWGRLQDFEDRDLSRWTLEGPGTIHPDSAYATERQTSLRAEFGAGARLAVDLDGLWRMEELIRQKFGDEGGGGWKIYEAVFTDIYARGPVELNLTFRDSLGGSWSTAVTLRQGLNHLQHRRDQLLRQGVDFNSLRSIEYAPAEPCTLWLDALRTWEYQPELDQRGRMDIVYRTDVVSPHIKWQQPDAAGPVRGLFAPTAGAGRVMIELMQRFELEPTTVTFEPTLGLHRWAFGDFYSTRALDYDHVTTKFSISYAALTSELESDKPFEVIVLPPMRGWQNWPPELRAALLKRVEAGCGLVLFQPTAPAEAGELWRALPLLGNVAWELYKPRPADQPELRPTRIETGNWVKADPAHYITRGLPLELIPGADLQYVPYQVAPGGKVLISSAKGDPLLAVGRYGRGRVAVFSWVDVGMFPTVNDPVERKNGLPYWEYLYALVGRTVRWAAGREEETGIRSAALVERGGKLALEAGLSGLGQGDRLEVVLRGPDWRELERMGNLPAREKLRVDFPKISPRGRLIAELRLIRPGGRVADFAAVSREFGPGAKIAAVVLDRETVSLGEAVTGSVKLSEGTARVALALTDNRDRLLAVDTLAGGGKFSLSSAGCLTRRAVLTARALAGGGQTVDLAAAELFVDRPSAWDDYEVMMYRFSPQVLPGEWGFLDRYMESLHVTAWAAIPPELTYRSNLGIQAETRLDTEESWDGIDEEPYREAKKQYLATRDKKYLQRLYCQHDPAYLQRQKDELQRKIGGFKRFSPLSYYCYEEPSYTHYGDAFDLCFGPHCLTAFRDWLKTQYGTLEKLNTQWGTAFGAWEDVIPDDTFEAQARGNYSAWADHRLFSELTYAGNYSYVRDIVRSIDPEGRVMMTGTQRTVPHNGYDYFLLDQAIDHTQPYGQPELHKAFMRQGGKITGCTGYGVFGPKLAYELWGRLFDGHTAGSAIFWQFSTIDPDYVLCKSGRDMAETFGELRQGGMARLVAAARWSPSAVVLFWSMPAVHGTWIQDGKIVEGDGAPSLSFERWESNYESWKTLLNDLGVPFRAMGHQQLDSGWLAGCGAKILVLPNTIALSAKGAEEIRRFVEAGGTVIGDAQAGIMDGHCKYLPAGALDGLFGIGGQQAGYLPPAATWTARGEDWGLATADPGVKAAGAEALELGPGLPPVLHRQMGQGAAFYLNAYLAGYGRLRAEGRGAAVRRSAGLLLERAGYSPLVSLRPVHGADLAGVRLVSYDLGERAGLVGLVRDYRMDRTRRRKSWSTCRARATTMMSGRAATSAPGKLSAPP